MKKFLLSVTFLAIALTPAIAADAVELPVASTHDWSGLYLGAHVGGGGSQVDWAYSNGLTADHNGSGVLGGVQVGYNIQSGNVVYGIEADISAANIDGGTSCPNPNFSCESNVKMLGSLRGRVGFAMDKLLIYGTGGLGYGTIDISTTSDVVVLGTSGTVRTKAGWTLGAGLEYALDDHWSLKGEYKYFDFGKAKYTIDDVDAKIKIHTGVIGLNYKF